MCALFFVADARRGGDLRMRSLCAEYAAAGSGTVHGPTGAGIECSLFSASLALLTDEQRRRVANCVSY